MKPLGLTALSLFFVATMATPIFSSNPPGQDEEAWVPLKGVGEPAADPAEYREAIRRTADMVSDPKAQALAQQHGLQVLNLTWEDTGRYKNSAVGPNISDMTIQVESKNSRGDSNISCMPVIRKPNYSDVTTDIDPKDFTLLVGNQKGGRLQRVSLYDFLKDPLPYLSNPRSWRGANRTLLAPRDGKVLVSAQACFLPVPKHGLATFNPVLFNYHSVSGDPGVLTILATREGTSTTIIDNKRDAFSEGPAWGQRLFLNHDGMRASLTGQRESDFNSEAGRNGGKAATPGMSMVLLIQIPLKQKYVSRPQGEPMFLEEAGVPATNSAAKLSDVESAVIGHGADEGPYTEIDNLAIQRDPNFPVRVTVQFYKATSNGIVGPGDMAAISDQIDSVYRHGGVVGSLVTQGETGRPTEYVGCKVQPPDWWNRFWEQNLANTGLTREEAIAQLRKLLGDSYKRRPVCTLYLRDLLRRR